jgi:hypothetical protein
MALSDEARCRDGDARTALARLLAGERADARADRVGDVGRAEDARADDDEDDDCADGDALTALAGLLAGETADARAERGGVDDARADEDEGRAGCAASVEETDWSTAPNLVAAHSASRRPRNRPKF